MAQFVEKVYRSRQTLLDVLRDRGYDTVGAAKFGPEEIREALAATSNGKALEFTVRALEGRTVPTPTVRVYIFLSRIKQKLPGFLTSLETPVGVAPEAGSRQADKLGSPVDPANTSIICLINEPVVPVFHQASVNSWVTRNLRLSFFYMDSFQMNPLSHYLVPPHEIVPKVQHEALMKSMYVTQKSHFPFIRYHEDPITRVIGSVPGDIIKITRPSPTSGEYIVYRICTP
jgi:DNA-directed RNA polymerase subunit H (RpoH/RPB5)